jgi:glucokinase
MYGYFDIGGTKTRVAVSRDGKSFGEPVKFDTPQDFEEGIHRISEELRKLSGDQVFLAIGGGIAGPLNHERTTLLMAPHLPQWVGKPIVEALLANVRTHHVYLENDSAIVGLGESHYGAGKGDAIMAYITVSTGVGGVRIVDGHIDRSSIGFEPGHQILDIDKTMFPELHADEAEEIISGTAIAERFHKKAYEVTDPAVWEELAKLLAYLLNNVTVFWSPDSIVLGGSMVVGDPAIPVDRVAYHLDQILTIFPKKPVVKEATLKDLGGLYGAMAFVAQRANTLIISHIKSNSQ